MEWIKMNNLLLFINACCMVFLIGNVDCHPTIYKVDRNVSCYTPYPAKIYSWHIHVVYNDQQAKVKKQALTLLAKFREIFKEELGEDCTGTFHQGRLCVFKPIPSEPYVPFPVAQWAVFVPVEHFASKVPWFMQNRIINGVELDLLVHPNSGCELEDHTWWPMWGGEKWRLNTDSLSHDKPYPW